MYLPKGQSDGAVYDRVRSETVIILMVRHGEAIRGRDALAEMSLHHTKGMRRNHAAMQDALSWGR